ncbi:MULTISPECIES: putative CRISPR-associated protein [Pyrobaculum]|uniref:Putative CRISPR-associated protein, APE2256 family n=2 Tax=Pyrobaculum arsenaticum TaxID=121277 RepID=A4WJX0_PYRAR|nr:putative CRISPR-associated protein [Pyrobaculum arsenaticum]ABP50687.1 putative CRISPR-associated protein, APE2256 family [Pyrobaculum arsenaticum DSM 13514]MCY0891137.1 putative CRISPR-associated protein [Pyrobaculum arsenaticum]NYR14380.1 putative CRISPR-associated protein [Pyrobaculum arsenaticum]
MRPVFFGITVGASLLTNAAKRGLLPEGLDRLRPDDPRQAELDKAPRGALVEYAALNPRECCAELNTVAAVLERWSWMAVDLSFVLYASDTGQGRLAAEVIKEALCRVASGFWRGGRCGGRVRVVEGLGWEDKFGEALLRLATAIREDFSEARREGRMPYIVATGGFKPESTFAVVAAYAAGAVGVFYIHETFRRLVELPMVPLQLHGAVAKFARGEADEHRLARELGLDVQHLEAVGLLVEEGGARRLNPLLERLL